MSESLIRLKNNLRSEIEQAQLVLDQAKARQRRVDRESESGRVAYEQAAGVIAQVSEEVEEKREALAGIESGEGDYYGDLLAAEESVSRAARLRQKSRAKEKAKTNAINEVKRDAEHKRYRKERRGDRWDKRKFGIYLRKFQYAGESLPPYIRENLRNMPNNKGYVWRGVYFYGDKLPERGEPSVVFEKNRGGGLLIRKSWPGGRWEDHEKQRNGNTKMIRSGKSKFSFVPPADWPVPKYAAKRRDSGRRDERMGGRDERMGGAGRRRDGHGVGKRETPDRGSDKRGAERRGARPERGRPRVERDGGAGPRRTPPREEKGQANSQPRDRRRRKRGGGDRNQRTGERSRTSATGKGLKESR